MHDFEIHTLIPTLISFIIIFVWSIKWKGKLNFPEPSKVKKQTKSANLVLVITFLLSAAIIFAAPNNIRSDNKHLYGIGDVIGQALVWILLFVPMFVAIINDKLKLSDLQFNKSSFVISIIPGILTGMVFILFNGGASNLLRFHVLTVVYAGLQYLVVGLAEETLFRGYIQVRWMASLGQWKGLLLASFFFSLFHLPAYAVGMGMPFGIACLEVAEIFPISLLFGFALMRTGNISASVIIHFLLDWIQM